MAARGYESYLRVLQVSLTSERSIDIDEMSSIDIDEMSRFKTTCSIHFRKMKKWSPTAKTRMLGNMKQDMNIMKNKSR